ncbi:aspartyl protease AED3-like [Salvia hispanica]|uniref:aspartyl protease AED3-like n=1 Tax=Salvia hispanica TaxID=49212 RepID=UPI0020095F71|nr:aspartyl protease AED3-like [Salvia hispanica]
MAALLFSLLALFLCHHPSTVSARCGTIDQGSTLQLLHVNSPCSPFRPKSLSWENSVLQMQAGDKSRLQYLSSLVVPIASGRTITQNPTYIVRVNIGTPPQQLLVALDTSNDAAWIPCTGCVGCSSSTFDPAKSSTFKPLRCGSPQCSQVPNPSCGGASCGFNTTYGGSSISAGLVQDSIALATDSISGYTFGCVQKSTGSSFPAQGLLGLGRGPLSLMSQSTSLYQSTFSYCLPGYKSTSFAGSLTLGPHSQPVRIKTTQLLRNPRRSSLYYVNLVAIRVGGRIVDIPPSAFAFDPNTGAGTIFDSGTVFTILVKPAYEAVRDEVRRRMRGAAVSSLGGFDTCYNVAISVPTITFMFTGMNVTLAQDNFVIRSSAGSTSCLAMAAAAEGSVNSGLNVIASFQQQNHRILIDGPNSKLGVAREACT